MSNIPIEVKRQILASEIKEWRAAQYQLEVRYRVNKRIGADAEVLNRIETELARCENAIDALQEELGAIEREVTEAESAP